MFLRTHDGTIVFAACRMSLSVKLLRGVGSGGTCGNDRYALAFQHNDLHAVMRSDFSVALSIVSSDDLDRSAYGHIAAEMLTVSLFRTSINVN